MSGKPETCVEALLWELCGTYGYCLPPDEHDALLAHPPEDVEAFVDAVVVADGGNTATLDKYERRHLIAVVADWLFDDGRGRGTRSGLPRA